MLIEALLTRYLRHVLRGYMHMDDEVRGLPAAISDTARQPLLYVHVPFCRSLCPFCTFHRVRLSHPRAEVYFDALRREIRHYHDQGYRFSDVYVGGGTPTVLPDELRKTLELIQSLNDVKRLSVETNPSELDTELINMLVACGVNRISVGVQSFDDELLKRMGRFNAYGSSAEIVEQLARVRSRIDTCNVDMIFNLPGQTPASLRRDLDILINTVDVNQVSYYPLMEAPSARRAMAKTMGGGPQDHERRFYYTILDTMRPHYAASSAWCFAKDPSQVDEYIVDHNEYLGVGSGAFSYLDGMLFSSTFSINGYVNRIDTGMTGITGARKLSHREQVRYDFLVGLFGTRLAKSTMVERHGRDYTQELGKEINVLRLLGAIRESRKEYCLTRAGMYYWVVMMREFFTGVNVLRDNMRTHIRRERNLLRQTLQSGVRQTGVPGQAPSAAPQPPPGP